jgi:hypothetical protein
MTGSSPDTTSGFAGLPGADVVGQGLNDLAAGRETLSALLVSIGSPRLRACGLEVPVSESQALAADRKLYRLLALEHGNEAHSRYNALIRQLVSFERALEQRCSRAARRLPVAV